MSPPKGGQSGNADRQTYGRNPKSNQMQKRSRGVFHKMFMPLQPCMVELWWPQGIAHGKISLCSLAQTDGWTDGTPNLIRHRRGPKECSIKVSCRCGHAWLSYGVRKELLTEKFQSAHSRRQTDGRTEPQI